MVAAGQSQIKTRDGIQKGLSKRLILFPCRTPLAVGGNASVRSLGVRWRICLAEPVQLGQTNTKCTIHLVPNGVVVEPTGESRTQVRDCDVKALRVWLISSREQPSGQGERPVRAGHES